MWVSKVGLISVGGIAATWFLLKVAIIPISYGIISNFPGIYVTLRGRFAPPYIFIIFNILILVIAFSSSTFRAHNNNYSLVAKVEMGTQQEEEEEEVVNKEVVSMASFEKPANLAHVFTFPIDSKSCSMCSDEEKKEDKEETREDMYMSQKDGLDETWKLIMEGKKKPTTRQLRKSENWGSPHRGLDRASGQAVGIVEEESNDNPPAWAKKELRKSDTFKDSYSLRKEKSMSQDELNWRAEAFIKKFNLEMKLQRQESEQRFRELRSRGVYA